ncbi:methionine biosynthesis protein MetW [Thermosulfuriphilus ammonigenes]|uniref:Methionine biosynthesis protein MetW n=1 Tax=Thermosulfuriphilus ammonigenes TaxID=1936021 RepID=A0A6G7PVX7_9BACT|nr:methionine biosynthesis protein MetW [Thermosulfuriphilus ammonigenes]QIJ71812.1 methionine biosynthesis protein MetW [Thermosulfuriphilus ammonigenes]
MNLNSKRLRFDLQIIASWIEPGAKVIDLGCGRGELLLYLKEHKGIRGIGIEKDEAEVRECIRKGLSVIQGDLNEEVLDYPDQSFDFVILSQTLQQIYEPHVLLQSLLRIGRRVIVSFPNFSHWTIRFDLLLRGRAPKNPQLPYEWYNSPNIRVITIKDFRKFVYDLGYKVIKEAAVSTYNQDRQGNVVRFLANLRATYGIFMIGK